VSRTGWSPWRPPTTRTWCRATWLGPTASLTCRSVLARARAARRGRYSPTATSRFVVLETLRELVGVVEDLLYGTGHLASPQELLATTVPISRSRPGLPEMGWPARVLG
jgi:hypothetical protein